MRRTYEKDPPRIKRTIKNANQNYLSWLLGNDVPGRGGGGGALKQHEIKYFYELEKDERNEKSLKIMIKSLKSWCSTEARKIWIAVDYFLDIVIQI